MLLNPVMNKLWISLAHQTNKNAITNKKMDKSGLACKANYGWHNVILDVMIS